MYRTGRGGVKVRSRWRYDKQENLIEIYEIPYSTSIEAILDKVAELIKAGKISEISDMRDETDLSGLKLAIDLKRGADPEKLMAKLFRLTPLQDTVSCNFNILIAGMPRVMGVGEILNEWTAWRTECVRRRVYFVLNRKKDKLHLLQGLKRILLDIDKAIAIIRETEEEAEVIPNLMIGFGIDQVQAEYVAEIKLRNINKEYILKRVQETDDLQKEIADLEDTLQKPARIRKHHRGRAGAGAQKVRCAPADGASSTATRWREYVEDDQPEDYPVHGVPVPGGVLQEDHPQVPAHERRAEIQGGRRPAPAGGDRQQRRDHVLYRPVPGVQDPGVASSATARPASWATICRADWPWTRASGSSSWCCRGTTPGACCFSMKTARPPGWSCPPMPRCPTAGS
ncbi:MAG: DNA gyrase subunit A [Dysosmobacter sp.]